MRGANTLLGVRAAGRGTREDSQGSASLGRKRDGELMSKTQKLSKKPAEAGRPGKKEENSTKRLT